METRRHVQTISYSLEGKNKHYDCELGKILAPEESHELDFSRRFVRRQGLTVRCPDLDDKDCMIFQADAQDKVWNSYFNPFSYIVPTIFCNG